MPDIDNLIAICEGERLKIRALEIPEIVDLAQDIAYYTAMIDAAEDDPIEDLQTHEAIMRYFKKQREASMDRYMSLINDNL